ncbi:MAG TPA: IS200/IS605 family transposase [Candidatus Acidoferrum sp.]|nr:IS200/IS605 family transposase [Candidatus Acidoferrum sp.]
MANTFSQIYIQAVFAPEGRQNLIRRENKEELHRYITGIITGQGQKLLAIHCMPDHTHVLIGLRPAMALSDLMEEVKAHSSGFINEKKWVPGRFNWQAGYGAFSYGHSQLTSIIQYIRNQETHHAKKSFRDEYLQFLKNFDVAYDPKYLFDFDSLAPRQSAPDP